MCLRKILFICLLFPVSLLQAQQYLGYGKEEVVGFCRNFGNADYRVVLSDSTGQDSAKFLQVSILGAERIELTYFFGDTLMSNCDSIAMHYYCGPCAEHHVDEFLRSRKWKQLDSTTYIERKHPDKFWAEGKPVLYGSTLMRIRHTPGQEVCTSIYFSIPMMEKEKWKALVK